MKAWLLQYYDQCFAKLSHEVAKTTDETNELGKAASFLLSLKLQNNPPCTLRHEMLVEKIRAKQVILTLLEKYSRALTKTLIQKEFSELQKRPKIKKVELSEQSLQITTKKLKVYNKNIGNYLIRISFDSENPITITNLEHKVGDHDHWFVSNSKPCFGTWKAVINKYYDTGHLFLLLDTIMHFLLSTNSGNGFRNCKEWINDFNINSNTLARRTAEFRHAYIPADAIERVNPDPLVIDDPSPEDRLPDANAYAAAMMYYNHNNRRYYTGVDTGVDAGTAATTNSETNWRTGTWLHDATA